MPLESFSQPFNPDEPGRKLREVQVEFDEESSESTKQKYEALKNSRFYDAQNDCWYNSLELGEFSSEDQLLGVVVLAEFDKDAAQKKYAELLHSKLYDPEYDRWYWRSGDLDYEAKTFSYLVELQLDVQDAEQHYDRYLEFYKNARHATPQPITDISELVARNELSHVLIQTFIDPDKARLRYAELQSTPLYNARTMNWVRGANMNWSRTSTSTDCLLGILIEIRLGISGAREQYEALKHSLFFDERTQLWNMDVANNGRAIEVIDKKKYIAPQLMGILVDAALEKQNKQLGDTERRLPEERNF